MKYYEALLERGCFSREGLVALTGNYNTAGTLIKNYQKKGYIRKVRKNLYVAINLADSSPVASPYRIASAITDSAYVSHHAAFAYHGFANQVSYRMEVSSKTPFKTFAFEGNEFFCVQPRANGGVLGEASGVRVTDTERTVLDGIYDVDRLISLEELLRCLQLIPFVREDRLLAYLAKYDRQVMYQKTGYILRHFQREWNLSEAFFEECAAHIGKSTRYLTKAAGSVYDGAWRLMVPKNFATITTKGAAEDDDI
jgi:predicted transcriptional regulator of viral defense system